MLIGIKGHIVWPLIRINTVYKRPTSRHYNGPIRMFMLLSRIFEVELVFVSIEYRWAWENLGVTFVTMKCNNTCNNYGTSYQSQPHCSSRYWRLIFSCSAVHLRLTRLCSKIYMNRRMASFSINFRSSLFNHVWSNNEPDKRLIISSNVVESPSF